MIRGWLERLIARPLACIELIELASGYLDGDLAPRLRARIDAHLTGCDGCTRYVAQLRRVIEAAGRLVPPTPPAESVARLVDAFRAAPSS
jgi:anti-sigma factor RsiW